MRSEIMLKVETSNLLLIDSKKDTDLIDRLEQEIRVREFVKLYRVHGTNIKSKSDFYREIHKAIPLIKGGGYNLNALLDLIRTMNYKAHGKYDHYLLWDSADVLLENDPCFFYEVMDTLSGASKELLVGDEQDRIRDPAEFVDWHSTTFRFVISGSERLLEDGYDYSRLQGHWHDVFWNLDANTEVVSR